MTALPAEIAVERARLPQAYEAAKNALANCANIDECQQWADKAAALASYAKQADDETLHKLATRIRARAVRRCGELLKQFDARGGDRTGKSAATVNSAPSQRQVGRDAGLSDRQRVTAVRVANVPRPDFDAAVESDAPPTTTKLADMGRKPRLPDPPDWAKAPKPEGFQEATHFIGALKRYAEVCKDPQRLANGIMPAERGEVARLIAQVDSFHDLLVVNLGGDG